MKSYIVLLVALTMLVKPLWPVAEYIMNYDYIVNVLCENKDKPELKCDGKCYLAQMLAQESSQNDKNPFGEEQSKTEVFKILEGVSVYTLNKNDSWTYDTKMIIDFSQDLHSLLLVCDITQPPEVS